jgi:gluconokinase
MTRLISEMIVIVAGVSGSGKTTVGALLAGRLHWRFADGDTFHLAASIAKMHAGIPLTDEDRRPWLRAITKWMDERIAHGESAVVTCSALKRYARDALLAGRPEARMFFLSVDRVELARRLGLRHDHFFPERLLGTQLRALEPPQPDETGVTVVAGGHDPEDTAAAILAIIRPGVGADQGESHEADA